MELKDFVSKTLTDIVSGVEAAQSQLGNGISVATSDGFRFEKLPQNVLQDHGGRLYSVVEFDVAVTTTDAVTGGGGINVLAFTAGGKVEGKAETASRLQFAVTLQLK